MVVEPAVLGFAVGAAVAFCGILVWTVHLAALTSSLRVMCRSFTVAATRTLIVIRARPVGTTGTGGERRPEETRVL